MVIGCEGVWGTVLSILVVYPLAYLMPGQDNGSFENPFDAIAMITNNSQLLVGRVAHYQHALMVMSVTAS